MGLKGQVEQMEREERGRVGAIEGAEHGRKVLAEMEEEIRELRRKNEGLEFEYRESEKEWKRRVAEL